MKNFYNKPIVMYKVKLLFTIFSVIIIAASCGKTSYKKTKGGMPYKIISGKDTQQLRPGNMVKINIKQIIDDSVLFSTFGGIPAYVPISQTVNSYDLSELWSELRKGDSLIMIQMTDTFIAKFPETVPPYFKQGYPIKSYIKIIEVFPSDSLARIDLDKEIKQLTERQIKEVEDYLAKNKIKARRTPSGAFVQVIKSGQGNNVDSGNYVTVNYTGTSWSGMKFDSNTDSAFGHVVPLSFTAGRGEMIRGFDEAVQLMNKGMVAKVYIPGMLAYGPQGSPPKIKPYEHLIFDLEITDIKDKAPSPPPAKPQQKN